METFLKDLRRNSEIIFKENKIIKKSPVKFNAKTPLQYPSKHDILHLVFLHMVIQ